MPDAVFPDPQRSAIWPFLELVELREQGGDVVPGCESVPVSIWPATRSSNDSAGRHHSHGGEGDPDFADDLQAPNRSLVTGDGTTYKIVGATPAEFTAHVVLELNRTSGKS